MRKWTFAKGHANLSDFVVITDRHGMLAPGTDDVAFLCDRRRGVGADAFIRAILSEHIDDWDGESGLWYLDAREPDGSPSAMWNGNLRLFARYLRQQGLVDSDFIRIATPRGLREAITLPDDTIRVDTPPPAEGDSATVRVGDRSLAGQRVTIDGEHVVCLVDDVATLASAASADGADVVLAASAGDDGVIRVRTWLPNGSEVMSCGSGAIAAAAAVMWDRGEPFWSGVVESPGGRLGVGVDPDSSRTIGPATIVAVGTVEVPDRA